MLTRDVKSTCVCTDKKFLRKKSVTPILGSTECKETVTELLSYYEKLGGKIQGLAAIQIWRPVRIILVRYKKGRQPEVLLCPTVLDTIGLKNSIEGCESEPGVRYCVKRPLLAKVAYYTSDGKYIEKWLTYKKARIFCHEVDHLDGILLEDRGVKVPNACFNSLSKN